VGVNLSRMNVSMDLVMSVPHGTPTFTAMERLTASFGSGTVTPFKLMMEPATGGTVFNREFWHLSQDVLMTMTKQLPHTNPKDFNFACRAQGTNIQYSLVETCRGPRADWPAFKPVCSLVNYPIKEFVKPDGSAMYGYIMLSEMEPMGNLGPTWLREARSILKNFEKQHPNIRLTLSGQAADALDIMSKSYDLFPRMILLTFASSMVVLGVAFKSVVVPVRSLVTTVMTLLWVYGGSVLTYQNGIFEWTGLWGFTSTFDGQYWMMPVICFSMVVGICLDYDIFLLSRIAEKREEGMTPDEAIRSGLCETGGVITAAGCIMAIAFAGLMFTSMLLVNLISFYMVFAVLYDTFVVNTFLSPAMMSLLGRFHWFPSGLYRADFKGNFGDVKFLSPLTRFKRRM